MATALQLLGAVVHHRGVDFVRHHPVDEHGHDAGRYACRHANGTAPDGIVGLVLAHAGVSTAVLVTLGDQTVADLYAAGRFPVSITLGALVVLRAAQQYDDRGFSWREVLVSATTAAIRMLDVIPDAVVRSADA